MEFEENMINNRPATQAVMERDELILREQNALKIFNKNIIPWWDRFEQALNPNNQKEMTLYSNFVFKNLDIPKTLIWEQLENLKYVTFVDEDGAKAYPICIKPYTDYYIKPDIYEGNKCIKFTQHLVISKEAEEKLQQFCDEFRNEKRVRIIEQIGHIGYISSRTDDLI